MKNLMKNGMGTEEKRYIPIIGVELLKSNKLFENSRLSDKTIIFDRLKHEIIAVSDFKEWEDIDTNEPNIDWDYGIYYPLAFGEDYLNNFIMDLFFPKDNDINDFYNNLFDTMLIIFDRFLYSNGYEDNQKENIKSDFKDFIKSKLN